MINNIGGGWERNKNSMFKSRKMSKFVDEFMLGKSIYGINVSGNVVI